MRLFLKILTLPIWLPFKILWFMSKLIAFIFLAIVLAVIIYVTLHII